MAQYIRYTKEEQKAALKKMEEIGVTKASKELGISVATLYKWQRKPNEAPVSNSTKKRASKKAAVSAPATMPETVAPEAVSIEGIQAQLMEDDGLREKMLALEAENARLRETIAKLKKMLLAVIE